LEAAPQLLTPRQPAASAPWTRSALNLGTGTAEWSNASKDIGQVAAGHASTHEHTGCSVQLDPAQ
jgi:hypothetical protein